MKTAALVLFLAPLAALAKVQWFGTCNGTSECIIEGVSTKCDQGVVSFSSCLVGCYIDG
jgi:hypothetical protein